MPSFDFFDSADCQAAMLARQEQLLLYSLIYALEPKRVLEIGFAAGGSSRIILAAICATSRTGQRLVSIDPQPTTVPEWTTDPRFELVRDTSPQAIPHAVELLGGAIDFCLIDADHSEASVYADSGAVAPHIASEGYVLYHDAYYPTVASAVDRFLDGHAEFIDCGIIARFHSKKEPSPWGGFRLLRRVAYDETR
ncbi:MAG: class I SAM-dependent methyltransferase [Pirellulales bacterium]